MTDWLEALRVASESPAIDLKTAGVLDDLRHALVIGRLVDREDFDCVADTEDVYQKETWLPDVPGEGRYVWMIRSDIGKTTDE